MNPRNLNAKKFVEDELFKGLDKETQQKMENDSDGSDSNPSEDEFSQKELKKLLPKTFDIKKKTKKSTKLKKRQTVQKKENKQKELKEIKVKKNDKESVYKKFFSSRNSEIEIIPIR